MESSTPAPDAALDAPHDALAPDAADVETQRRPVRVKWYRCPVPREELSQLNKRSDLLGLAQTVGFLAVVLGGAALAISSMHVWPWYVTALLVLLNGHTWHFLINGFHELVHESVFRTRWLNGVFLRVLSFLGWYNHHFFWASHTEHHKFTLHPPDDQEVVLPQNFDLRNLWKQGIINWRYPYYALRGTVRTAAGHVDGGEWAQHLFPQSNVEGRRKLRNWARVLLVGQGLLLAGALALGWWVWPLVFTFPMMFGGWLHALCNSSQHIGLQDNVPDFRRCCRTIYLSPPLQFLYWHMNFHTEHHMYAAVPCYNLPRLHRLIRHDMPPCPRGLVETWRQITEIQRRQKEDPSYQYEAPLPTASAT